MARKVQVRRTTTEIGWCYIEADSDDEAREELAENLAQGFTGRFDVEELVEEHYELNE